VDYIKQQMQAGVPKDAVRKALGDAGWPPADVDDSIKGAEPAGGAGGAGAVQSTGGLGGASVSRPAGQATVNPAVAMGGVDVTKKAMTSATGSPAASASDKFFSKPAVTAQASVDDEDDEHPQVKKFMTIMIVMGVVILLLAGALAFVYFSLNGQLDAAHSGVTDNSAQLTALQQQVNQLTSEKSDLTAQTQALGTDNQVLLSELGFLVPASATSTAPMPATIKGTLSGNASTTFVLLTPRNVRIIVANSKDAKVSAALAPLAAVTSTGAVTLSGTHPVGSLNLTVTAVNGAAL
jgi:cell division protein FtsL